MKPLLFVLSLVFSVVAVADDSAFRERIEKAADEAAATGILEEWKQAEPASPEPFIVEANRLYKQALTGVQIDAGKPEGDDIELKDPQTGEVKGRIRAGEPAPAEIDATLALLERALALAPDRLDIRAGMAFICQECGRFDRQLEILTAMVEHAKAEPEEQRWKAGAALEEPVDKFVAAKLHGYATYYYRQESSEGDARFGKIATLTTQSYPDSAIGWNDLALFKYLAEKDTKAAAECLEKAAKIDPEDLVVQMNLAQFYTEMKQPDKAKAVYDGIIRSSKDADYVQQARKKREALDAAGDA